MSILSRSKPTVKPTRNTPRPASRFGSGILPSCPVVMAPYTFADADWAVGVFNDPLSAAEYEAREDAYNEMLDQAAWEDACLERYQRGICL